MPTPIRFPPFIYNCFRFQYSNLTPDLTQSFLISLFVSHTIKMYTDELHPMLARIRIAALQSE